MKTSQFVQSMRRHAYLKKRATNLKTTAIQRVSFAMPLRYGNTYLIAG